MDQIATIVLPVFGLIGIGYAVAWTGLLRPGSGDAISDFVFVVAIPLLVVNVIATADFSGLSAWRLWLAFFIAFALIWVLGALIIRRFFGRDARAGLVGGLAAGYGNTTLIGIPLALTAFGSDGSAVMALIIAVQLPLMMTAIAILMVRAERLDNIASSQSGPAAILRSITQNLLTNPIVVGLAVGVIWRLLEIPFVGIAADLVTRLADVAGTLALFAMGMTLRKYGVRGSIAPALVLTALKLLAMPTLVFALARLVGLPDTPTKVAVMAAACPTGITPFLVAARFGTGEGLASNVIFLSTVLAVASVALWLNLVEWL